MRSRKTRSPSRSIGRLREVVSTLEPLWRKPLALFLGFIFSCLLTSFPAWGQENFDRWRRLSPKEKEEIRRNYQRWQNLPPRDKEHLREEWNRWRNLPQDRRKQLRQRYNELRRGRSDD